MQLRTDAWFGKARQAFEPLYRWIRDECGVATQPVTTRILEGVECGFDLETVKRYLSDDLNLWHDGSRITDEFFVVTQPPWSALGAICVYELRPE